MPFVEEVEKAYTELADTYWDDLGEAQPAASVLLAAAESWLRLLKGDPELRELLKGDWPKVRWCESHNQEAHYITYCGTCEMPAGICSIVEKLLVPIEVAEGSEG